MQSPAIRVFQLVVAFTLFNDHVSAAGLIDQVSHLTIVLFLVYQVDQMQH